ncbi:MULTISPECIES: hypothetical protein [unclassified Chryseobacterium]|uniref:hypothetical protein n=1 Tax=unclassified Chryseobacterium TaxID=2593645 RepID=UPI00226A03A9|nr:MULTISPECIES: hypothetical protein [unclassified Chryseobacterium]
MKTKILILLLFCWTEIVFGQISKFRERQVLVIGKNQNRDFPIYYLDKNDKKDDLLSVDYNTNSEIISKRIAKDKVLNWDNKKELTLDVLKSAGLFNIKNNIECITIKANIKAEKGKLLIYPWKISDVDSLKNKNDFLENNRFCIILGDNVNFKIKMNEVHAGVMSIPLKAYIGRRNKDKTGGMVETSVGIGGYVGYKFYAKTHYVKLSHEDDYRVYNSGFSINGILGLSAVELDEDNVKNDSIKFRGKFPALNTGAALGYHYRDIGVLFSVGFDIPLNKYGSNWNFKGKPWIGLGLGYKLF